MSSVHLYGPQIGEVDGRDYALPESSEAFIYVEMSRLMVRSLARR